MTTILDATCGGRMMWWDKSHPDVLFVDRRVVPPGAKVQQPLWNVEPDLLADYRALPFSDNSFDMVVFDPPHMNSNTRGTTGIMAMTYGTITDLDEVVAGLHECLRVASSWVVFKWNDADWTIGEIIERSGINPLFGHRTAKSGRTIWAMYDARRAI